MEAAPATMALGPGDSQAVPTVLGVTVNTGSTAAALAIASSLKIAATQVATASNSLASCFTAFKCSV